MCYNQNREDGDSFDENDYKVYFYYSYRNYIGFSSLPIRTVSGCGSCFSAYRRFEHAYNNTDHADRRVFNICYYPKQTAAVDKLYDFVGVIKRLYANWFSKIGYFYCCTVGLFVK